MSDDMNSASIDLVRWSFTVNPVHRTEVENYLIDSGADVLVREGTEFIVSWDEPEDDLTEVIETIWSLNGEPFDVTQEELHRLALHTIHHVVDESTPEAA